MRNYDRILTAVYSTPWAILPEKGRVLADLLTRKANGEDIPDAQVRAAKDRKRDGRAKPKHAAVGVIPVYGTITQRAGLFAEWSGGTSAEEVGVWVDAFADDPSIDAIVMEFDSPGGSVYGVEELAVKVAAAAKRKKVTAAVNSLAASAAYWIAAQASEVVVTPNGEVGSIGVYVMHKDRSAALEKAGERVTFVSAGELKTAGHSYGPLDDVSRAELQRGVDDYYGKFVAAVARGRRVSASTVRGGFGRGGVVRAEEAVRLGMADRIETFASVLGRYGVGAADLMRAADDRPEPVAVSGTRTPAKPPAPAGDLDARVRRMKLVMAEVRHDDWKREEAAKAAGLTTTDRTLNARLAGVAAGRPADGRTAGHDRAVCLHEAGHAVAALALGGRVEFVTANPQPDAAGGWKNSGSMADDIRSPLKQMVVIFAGSAADGGGGPTGSDLAKLKAFDPDGSWHADARQTAGRIVGRNRAAVERVAAALAEHRTLTGAEVVAVAGPLA